VITSYCSAVGLGTALSFLGAFAQLQKATVNLRHVCLSIWNNWAHTRWIFMKFDICVYFGKLSRKFWFD